jgi:hypothetical protein
MNKGLILLFSTVFSIVGSYVPVLFGAGGLLDGWSMVGGFIGGLLGIWLGVVASRRWG